MHFIVATVITCISAMHTVFLIRDTKDTFRLTELTGQTGHFQANSTTPSNQHTSRMIYTPPEECEGVIMQAFIQIFAFSLHTDGSIRKHPR